MTPPALVYLAMGLIVARISLDGIRTRGYNGLQWLQFLVDAARITLLWPLVLFVEKISSWLKSETTEQPPALSIPAIQTREEYSDGKIE